MIWARALHRLVKASDLPALSALSPLTLPHSGARAGEGSTEEEGRREEGGLIDLAGKVGIVTGVDEALSSTARFLGGQGSGIECAQWRASCCRRSRVLRLRVTLGITRNY